MKCPDCGSNDTVNRCLHCGCQWECTPDPRLKEAIEEIEKKAHKVVSKYDDSEISFSSGLYESITIIENHIPEVKQEVEDE